MRFYVEAGPPGLLFVVLLLALLVRRAVRAARDEADPVLRALMLAIAADLVAEACLQNLLQRGLPRHGADPDPVPGRGAARRQAPAGIRRGRRHSPSRPLPGSFAAAAIGGRPA